MQFIVISFFFYFRSTTQSLSAMASHLSAEQMESVKEPLKLCRPSGSSLMPITLRESVEVAKCIWNAAKNGKSSVYPYTHTLQR